MLCQLLIWLGNATEVIDALYEIEIILCISIF